MVSCSVPSEFERHRMLRATPSSESYEATRVSTGEKVVLTTEKSISGKPELRREAQIHKDLFGCTGIPRLLWEGEIAGKIAFAVTEYKQPLLRFIQKDAVLPVGVLLKVAVSMLKTLKAIHKRGYVHLSVSPENIKLNASGESLYLTGLSTAVLLEGSGGAEGVQYDPVFTSSALLEGAHPCRKDDLESLAYVLSYAYTKSLPWSFARSAKEVLAVRSRTAEWDAMANLPVEFRNFHSCVAALEREKVPNYHALGCHFREAAKRLRVDISLSELWVRKKYSRRGSEQLSRPCACPTETAPLPELSVPVYNHIRMQEKRVARQHSDEIKTTDNSALCRCDTVKTLIAPSLPMNLRHPRVSL